jgi:tetratricopeptide (TPR) repeat protein
MSSVRKNRLPWFIGLGLLVITLAVYWGLLTCDFINYDDNKYVTDNPYVHGGLTTQSLRWTFNIGYAGNWHPLTWISHMVDWQVFGPNPRWHHLTNLLLHQANILLLFALLQRTTGVLWRSAMVAALFALHPMHVESVAWVAERKDLLCTFFFILTLWAYARYGMTKGGRMPKDEGGTDNIHPQESPVQHPTSNIQHPTSNIQHPTSSIRPSFYYAFALLFFCLGLMSKPMLVTVPFVLLLLDYWPLGRLQSLEPGVQSLGSKARSPQSTVPPSFAAALRRVDGPRATARKSQIVYRILAEKLPFLGLAVISSVVTVLAQRRGGAVVPMDALPLAARFSNALVSYVRYAGKLLWPQDLAVICPYVYHWPVWLVLGAAACLLAFSWLALKLRRQAPYLPVGWFWFLGTLVPVIGLVQVGEEAIADRYTYIPSIGLFIAICWGVPQVLGEWPLRKPVLGLSAALALCACAVLTRSQAAYWRDSVSLFGHAVAVTKDNGIAHTALGAGLAGRNRLDEAIVHYNIALQLNPRYGLAHNDLGLALARLGRYDEAVAQYRRALALNPADAEAHYNLANALNPDYVDEAAVAGTAPLRRPDVEQSREHYLSTIALDPGHVSARVNLGNLEASAGNYNAAIRCYQDALRTDPRAAQAHYNLACTLANPQVRLHRKTEQTVEHFREALRLKPDWIEAMNNLAWILSTDPEKGVRNGAEAVRLATRACELTSYKNARVLGTLDVALAEAGRFAEAVATAQKGCELALAAGEKELADTARARLMLYQAGKPYHDPMRAE